MFFILTDIMHSVCGQFFILTHDSGIFVKFCQILSSQTSGISKNFFDFYPHMDSGQYFRGSLYYLQRFRGIMGMCEILFGPERTSFPFWEF